MFVKKIFHIIIILTLVVSCQNKKVEVAKPITNETIIMDSTM